MSKQLRDLQVTIVGLGLMGGSLALALRPHVAGLVAVEVDEQTRQRALEDGVVDKATADLSSGVSGADLVVLATPVRTILESVPRLPESCVEGCLVLDMGSTKEAICRALSELPPSFTALGGHPMCGKELSGLAAAEASLFNGQTFILCHTDRTTEAGHKLVLELVRAIGARPLLLAPIQHDRLVALVSHLPYFLAATLVAQAAKAAEGEAPVWEATASGFRDTSRLAGSDPLMLRDIVLTNRPAILSALRTYREGLDEVIGLLEADSAADLEQWLVQRQQEHVHYRIEKESRQE